MRRVPTGRAPPIRTVRQLGAYGNAADTARGTTESYVSAEICDINKIRASGEDLNAQWKSYCDCMFLEFRLATVYYVDGVNLIRPFNLTDAAWDVRGSAAVDAAQRAGKPWEMRVEKRPVENSEPWQRCLAHWCGSPSGCGQPDGRKDPFNVNPGMLADPWTEVGSATRGISMRYADNGLRDLTAFTTINTADYDPISLWKDLWGNPARYTLLVLKAQLVPFFSAYVNGILGPQNLAHMAIGAVQARPWLWPKGNREEGVVKWVLMPLLTGGKEFFGMVLKYIGKCGIGFNIPCGAGIVIQKMCQDQINDKDANGVSEFDRISSPEIQMVVMFLSKYGEELISRAINLVTGIKDSSILVWLEVVFKALLTEPLMQPFLKKESRFALKMLGLASGIAADIWLGKVRNDPILMIVDNIVTRLLGFRPSAIKDMLASGNLFGAKAAITAGVSTTGSTIVEALMLINNVQPALYSLVITLQDINNKIGGGLEELVSNVRGAIDGMTLAMSTAHETVSSVAPLVSDPGTSLPSTGPVATDTASMIRAIKAAPPATRISTGIVKAAGLAPKKAIAPAGKSGSTALVSLAAGGFVAGGPVGALIGAGIGLALSSRQQSLNGYEGAFGLDPSVIDLTTGAPVVRKIQTVAGSSEEKSFIEQTAIEAAETAETAYVNAVSTARASPKSALFMAASIGFVAWTLLGKQKPRRALSAYSHRRRPSARRKKK